MIPIGSLKIKKLLDVKQMPASKNYSVSSS